MSKHKNFTTEFKNEKGVRKFDFGPCTIDSIEKSKKAKGWFLIHLKQIVNILYQGAGSSSGFTLQNSSEFKSDSTLEFEDTRTKTERVTKEVLDGEGYEAEQILKGMIIRRNCYDDPQWDGHEAGFNGKFFTTDLMSEDAFVAQDGDKYYNVEGIPVVAAKKAAAKKTAVKRELVKTNEEDE
jgi:hypothetical protein